MQESVSKWVALGLAFGALACSGGERRATGIGGVGDIDAGTGSTGSYDPGPCTDGATRKCGFEVSNHNSVVTCFEGTQTCENGVWGDCQDGINVDVNLPGQAGAPGSSAQALSSPNGCANNPCDPYCEIYNENPDSGVSPDGGSIYNWQGGALTALPQGLVNKGLNEPCKSGSDCQFDNHCYHPVTSSSCSHSKCQTGTALSSSCDPCVTDICAANPSCCAAGGTWTQACVDAVKSVCDAECGAPTPSTCTHSVCSTGAQLDANCNSCVAQICSVDPTCCTAGASNWNSTCVNEVASVCGLSCPLSMDKAPPEEGDCKPWMPGETDSSCNGIDLAGGIPCDNTIPVCNHGTQTAPAGIKIIHFPANSQQYPKCNPDQSKPQMVTCYTSEPIPPGQCVDVTNCAGLNGNREIMINPAGTGHVNECSCKDNWTLYSGGGCVPPTCATGVTQQSFKQLNLYFVVDRSQSMVSDNGGIKWTAAKSALNAFFQSSGSAGLGVALEWFSLPKSSANGDGCGDSSCTGGACAAAPCSNPQIALGQLTTAAAPTDTQEKKLVDAVNAMSAGGMTPTYPALQGALQWATSHQTATPSQLFAVVLVTDGDPNSGCNDNITSIAALASQARLKYGVKTYVVGLPGSTTANLNAVATAGGTNSAFMVSGSNSSQIATAMQSAFSSIQNSNIQCSFALPAGGTFDPTSATVRFVSSGGAQTLLTEQSSSASCGNGWYFDDNTNPTKITLCPTTCAQGQSDPSSEVSFDVGCPKGYQKTVYSQTYQAACAAGSKPQWSVLAWDTTCPSTSNVVFEARTATTQADLANAAFTTVGTAGSTPSNTQICALTGPSPCPIDLFNEIGSPGNKQPWLELKITLNPSAGGVAGPTVNNWEITYSCPPGE